MAEVQFLFDNQLIAGVEKLIKESEHKLILISPFIDLDRRIQDALREKISKRDFELFVLFGKNEDNYYKSIKKDSLDFLKQFPNIEIRFNERLHAKFYQNDTSYIMTSLNLYDYSLSKNIEVGVIEHFGYKGFIGKAADRAGTLISQGIEKVRKKVFGMGQEVNPIEKFQSIFMDSTLLYKTEPMIDKKSGFKGWIGFKELTGFKVVKDNLKDNLSILKLKSENNTPKIPTPVQHEVKSNLTSENTSSQSFKTHSATQLSKKLGISLAEFSKEMQLAGLISNDIITPTGISKGLIMKNYMGKEYIAYPDNLPELKELKDKAFK